MKRILVIMLALMMFVGIVPAQAEGESTIKRMFVYDNADMPHTTETGDWITFQDNFNDGTFVRKKMFENGNAVHMHCDGENMTSRAGLIFAHMKTYDVQKYVMRLDLRVEQYGTFKCSTADSGPNPNWHFFNFFDIDKHGFINVGGNPVVYMPLGEFHDLAFEVDNTKHQYDFYYDGKYMATVTYDANYNWLTEFNFVLSGAKGGTDAYFDNFALYEADKMATKEEEERVFMEKYENVNYSSAPTRDELAEKVGDYNLFALEAKYGCWDGVRQEMPQRLLQDVDTVMAPVRCVAESFGAEVEWTPKETYVKFEGKTYTLIPGSKYVDGMGQALPREVKLINGTLYIPAYEFLSLFGTVYKDSEYDFYAVGKDDFSKTLDWFINAEEMYFYLVYYKPQAEEIIADFNKTTKDVHPRVLYTPELVEKIHEYVKIDEDMKKWYDQQIALADAEIGQPGIMLISSTSGLNTNWTRSPSAFTNLAQAYLFTKDRKYGDELWKQLEFYMDNNPDQNHRRANLNGSGCAGGIGQCLDWAYDYFTPEQRARIEEYVRSTEIEPIMRSFQELTGWPAAGNGTRYATDNIPCVTLAQISQAVMAFFESDPEYYGRFIENCFRQLEYYLPNYAPDGGYYEGPLYWNYATTNLVRFYEVAEMSLGTLYGYYDVFNISKTGEFPLYMQGATVAFNFSDAERSNLAGGYQTAYYFAKKNNDKEFATILVNLLRGANFAVGQRIYDPTFKVDEVKDYPLDGYFRNVEAGAMKERWNDVGAAYLGYRAGENSGGHQQLDKGHFVFDVLGERWAEDLGRDNYNYPSYFDAPKRYTYYVNRAEGHNVLLVNSKDRVEDQKHGVTVYRTETESKTGGAYNIIDMTPVYYEEDVQSARRGFMLTDFRKTAVVRDELVLNKNGCDIWWFMHTGAEIDILEGGKEAILTIGNKQLIMRLECTDPNAKFSVTTPTHLSAKTMPEPQYITEIRKINRLAINATGNAGEFNLTVNMRGVQISAKDEMSLLNKFDPIDKWEVKDEVKRTDGLSNIYVDGKAIADFSTTNTVYNFNVERGSDVPTISADAKDGWNIEYIQPTTLPGSGIIKVINAENPADYYAVKLNFKVPLYVGLPENMVEMEIASYDAQPFGGQSDGAQNAFDNNHDTRWAVEGSSQMILDLGEKKDIDAVSIAFYLGHERINYYTIEISDDKKEWKMVFDGETTGLTEEYMTVFLDNANARYVRLRFDRTSTGNWNSTNEIRILQDKE